MATLLDLIDKHEGGGGYNTLFGYSNRPGSRFAGTNVSDMTLNQLRDFSTGEYADWSRGKLGYTATPMGRYQIVGTTLRGLQDDLGLTGDEKFTPELQDKLFRHLADRRLASAKTPAEKRAAMRAEWEGYKHVSDADLDAAIAAYQGGGQMGLGAGPTVARAEAGLPLNTRTPPEDQFWGSDAPDYADNRFGAFQRSLDEKRAGLGDKLGLNNKQMQGIGDAVSQLGLQLMRG